jgi:hypothetical protein
VPTDDDGLGVGDVVGDVVLGGVIVVGGSVVLGGGVVGEVVLGGGVVDGGVVVVGGVVGDAVLGGVVVVGDDGAPVIPGLALEAPVVGLASTKDGMVDAPPDAPDCTQPVTVTICVEPDVAERGAGVWVCAAATAAIEAANTPATNTCCLMSVLPFLVLRAAGRPRMLPSRRASEPPLSAQLLFSDAEPKRQPGNGPAVNAAARSEL